MHQIPRPSLARRCCLPVALLMTAVLGACDPSDPGKLPETSSSSSSGGTSSSTSGGGTTSSSSGGPTCEPVTCEIACQWGFASGPDGCLICACLPDPRPCAQLSSTECTTTPQCALVTHGGESTCCQRAADGTIRCDEPPPPPVCMADSECRPGQMCNTWDYCEADPTCSSGNVPCPAVCFGRCVPATNGTEQCASDYDCALDEQCIFRAAEAPCQVDESGMCADRALGTCEPVACPTITIVCEDGSMPRLIEQPHACPIQVCGGACENLSPTQCEARPDCETIFEGGGMCDCACDPTDPNGCGCSCPPSSFRCAPRPECFSDLDCPPEEFCDFTYGSDGMQGLVALGQCVPRQTRCADLPEDMCIQAPGCHAVYGEVCPPCGSNDPTGGACAPCGEGFIGCRADDTMFCSRDLDCGPGMRCNTCPPDPSCPNCDVCGPPVCEPALPTRCTIDAECGPNRFCRIEACTDSIPPSCVGICEDAPQGCTGLGEMSCRSAPGCQPVYEGSSCNDGCHDEQGRLTSCGPCLAVACQPGIFSHCESVGVEVCCSDADCSSGLMCQFGSEANLGQCVPAEGMCGGANSGACPGGSSCQVVDYDPECGAARIAPSVDGGAAPPPACPVYACVPVAACQTDIDCGPGMRCNTCPSYCPDGDLNCPEVCGAPRCESLPPASCQSDAECATGCSCEGMVSPDGTVSGGTCRNAEGLACEQRPFRTCTSDAQCLPDEYCQRCPPGAACFAPDHCAPRERPYRPCSSDAECLPDEHCGDTCGGTMCDQLPHCVPGAPSLRTCSSNLQCRPDEYCQRCPPGALCLLPDHCEPRGFRTCGSDAECLPDESCSSCPPGVSCIAIAPPHCVQDPVRGCMSDADCAPEEHCEMCPPNTSCLLPPRCEPDQRW